VLLFLQRCQYIAQADNSRNTYGNGHLHLGRGLEAQAPHGLLNAECGHGALPEHVEGTSGRHCVWSCQWRESGDSDRWYSLRRSLTWSRSSPDSEAWLACGTCTRLPPSSSTTLRARGRILQQADQPAATPPPTLLQPTPREIPQPCLTMRSA
jgi:hypothetical protein